MKPELKKVHSQVLQDVVLRVDLALRAFLKRVQSGEEEEVCYPRFKGKNRYDSFSYPQSGFCIDGNMIWLSIGEFGESRDVKGEDKTFSRPMLRNCFSRLRLQPSSN